MENLLQEFNIKFVQAEERISKHEDTLNVIERKNKAKVPILYKTKKITEKRILHERMRVIL